MLPRKILHPKELDIKIFYPKDLREENLISPAKILFPPPGATDRVKLTK